MSKSTTQITHRRSSPEQEALSKITVPSADLRPPCLVLYFKRRCVFCTNFLPTFLPLLDDHNTPGGAGRHRFRINAVDCEADPHALSGLSRQARRKTVPHVVFHRSDGSQVGFESSTRRVEELLAFIEQNQPVAEPTTRIQFLDTPLKQPRIKEHLRAALYDLANLSRDEFGTAFAGMFSPANASIYFTGLRPQSSYLRRHELRPKFVSPPPPPPPARSSAPTPADAEIRSEIEAADDKLYDLFILVIPEKKQFIYNRRPVFGSIHGDRLFKLHAQIYVDVDVLRVLREQLRNRFTPAPATNIVPRLLKQEFGYTLI